MTARPSSNNNKSKTRNKTPKRRSHAMPRRPHCAYNIFFKEEKDRWLAAHARGQVEDGSRGSRFIAMTRAICRRWKELTLEEKQPYEAAAATDRRRHAEEMKAYRAAQQHEAQTARQLLANSGEDEPIGAAEVMAEASVLVKEQPRQEPSSAPAVGTSWLGGSFSGGSQATATTMVTGPSAPHRSHQHDTSVLRALLMEQQQQRQMEQQLLFVRQQQELRRQLFLRLLQQQQPPPQAGPQGAAFSSTSIEQQLLVAAGSGGGDANNTMTVEALRRLFLGTRRSY